MTDVEKILMWLRKRAESLERLAQANLDSSTRDEIMIQLHEMELVENFIKHSMYNELEYGGE